MIAFLAGPFGKLALGAVAVLAVLVGLAVLVRQHDARVLAENTVQQQAEQIAQQAATMAVMKEEQERAVSALETKADEAAAEARKSQAIRTEVHEAPHTTACLDSPAIAVELRELRESKAAHAASTAGRNPKKP